MFFEQERKLAGSQSTPIQSAKTQEHLNIPDTSAMTVCLAGELVHGKSAIQKQQRNDSTTPKAQLMKPVLEAGKTRLARWKCNAAQHNLEKQKPALEEHLQEGAVQYSLKKRKFLRRKVQLQRQLEGVTEQSDPLRITFQELLPTLPMTSIKATMQDPRPCKWQQHTRSPRHTYKPTNKALEEAKAEQAERERSVSKHNLQIRKAEPCQLDPPTRGFQDFPRQIREMEKSKNYRAGVKEIREQQYPSERNGRKFQDAIEATEITSGKSQDGPKYKYHPIEATEISSGRALDRKTSVPVQTPHMSPPTVGKPGMTPSLGPEYRQWES